MRPFRQILTKSVLRFSRDKDGAVTVDFIVLTAAIFGLCIAIYTLIGDATDDHTDRIKIKMDEHGITTYRASLSDG